MKSSFSIHLSNGSRLIGIGIRLALAIEKIPLIRSIPFVNSLCRLAKGLWIGHLTERNFDVGMPGNRKHSIKERVDFFESREIYDFIVVGSGPGAVAAVAKIPRNSSILVLEKGFSPITDAKDHHTLTHVSNDFEKAGQELILGLPLAQFAQAKVMGGGSEVNSGLYHRLPSIKKENYLQKLRISFDSWENSQQWVEDLLMPENQDLDPTKSLIARGAESSGYEFANIPRWRTYFSDNKFVHRGMNKVFWSSFQSDRNSRIVTGHQVDRVQKKSSGMLSVTGRNYLGHKFEFNARQVILSAGAIGTPRILMRSGIITSKQTNFQWHPMLRVVAKTPMDYLGFNDIDPFQAWAHNNQFKFGSAVSTPGIIALNLGRQITREEFSYYRSYYVSFVSSGMGGILPGSFMPWYKYSENDKSNIDFGIAKLRLLVDSGGGKIESQLDVNDVKPSTVHIFGTLPSNSGIFAPGTSRLIDFPEIQIADASLLPEGPGVNPQGVIMTAVHSLIENS